MGEAYVVMLSGSSIFVPDCTKGAEDKMEYVVRGGTLAMLERRLAC